MNICSRCILPESYPGISFDNDGVCNFCTHSGSVAARVSKRELLLSGLEQAIEEARGQGIYECIVAFSGGKDSSYTLSVLSRQYRLRCLAITIDNGFVAEQAMVNCKTITNALGIDHQIYRPSFQFLSGMYRTSATHDVHPPVALTRASSVCNSCIGLINTYMINTAVALGVPMIAGGYIAGQVPTDSAVLKLDFQVLHAARQHALKIYRRHFGDEADKHFQIRESQVNVAPDYRLKVINPLLALNYSEEEILDHLKPMGWVKPVNTGAHSTNCLLNDVGILFHTRRYGFHPYVAELAEQVRNESLSRDEALRRVSEIPNDSQIAPIIDRLGPGMLSSK